MKQITFTVLLLMLVSITFAQKAKISLASGQLSAGKLDVAKEAVDADLAANDEKTAVWYKAWLVRGQVYQGIFESLLPIYQKLDNDPVTKAWEAYQKALEYSKTEKKPEKAVEEINKLLFNKEKPLETSSLKNCFITKGANEFQEKEYMKAVESFETAISINKLVGATEVVDSAIIYYTALALDNAGNALEDSVKAKELQLKAIEYYSKAIAINYEAEKSYVFKSTTEAKLGKKEASLNTINEGLKAFPSSGLIIGSMINYYINNNELDKALISVSKAIDEGNDDPSYLYTKGALLDKQAEGYAEESKKLGEIIKETKKELFRARNNPAEAKKVQERLDKETAQYNELDSKSEKIYDDALAMYKQTLAKKADYFDAAYNTGAIYYNLGSKHELAASAISPTDDKDGSLFKAANDKATEYFKKSLDGFLIADQIKPNEQFTLKNLKNIYYKLKMTDKYKEMKEKIENL